MAVAVAVAAELVSEPVVKAALVPFLEMQLAGQRRHQPETLAHHLQGMEPAAAAAVSVALTGRTLFS